MHFLSNFIKINLEMVVVSMNKIEEYINKSNSTDLKHSYMDACSNKDFYKYISSLPIEEDILMKYTSTLEECFDEYSNCKSCKSFNMCKNKVSGYCLTPEVEEKSLNFSYICCDKKAKIDEEEKYLQNIKYYDIPQEIRKASFKDLYNDDTARVPIMKYIKDFVKNYGKKDNLKGLYLHGSFGSGKTYLVAALLNDMAKKKVKCACVYYPEFLRDLKASFKTDYEEKFRYIKKVPLLLLDDIGAENVSNFSRDEILGPILQYRMEENLPTFFTSNLTLEELENNLAITSSGVDKLKAKRIVERIKQLTVPIELISKNRRS